MFDPNINPILQNIKAAVLDNPDESDEIIIDSAANVMGISGYELLKRQPLVKTYCDDLKRAALRESN
jgi:hypothetical protein